MLRLARRRLRLRTPGLAEDVVDTVFMRLWENMLNGETPGDPVDWLEKHVGYEASNERKRTTKRWEREIPAGSVEDLGQIEEPGYALLDANPAPTYDDIEFQAGFDAALRALPDDERQAFILTGLRGLTVREAAGVLASNKDTVARQAEAARTSIRRELS